ncbi:MAG: dUTP diphosphatase [Gammaproteobacteria bacterium]|nr:dUTP diphosphatase [Gammaproteobacteria bacterium]MDP2141110.1 dUTP diphosphatase [Gammaproteobacteria bacterium]MDP2349215.1 dUTP diphosphatase [Gammaproteobacteria bacterium]
MLSTTQALVMLALQSRMNSKVEAQWVSVRFPYLRAVVIEGAEAIEHHGWKWWKKQHCDLSQLQMELVDIWHFVLSELLIHTEDDQVLAVQKLLLVNITDVSCNVLRFDECDYDLDSLDLVSKLELLIGVSVARRVELGLFKSLMLDCQMDWDSLFRQYVSKNVLNFFRQDNGYKEGTYRKNWQGREDNEHLVEIMTLLNPEDENYPDLLYRELAKRYQL